MDIKQIENESRGAFFIRGDDRKRLAEMTYSRAGETGIIIDHTEVDESLRGQKVGDQLLAEAMKFAREKGFKVYATCPFALRKLQGNEEYVDVFGG
jgi:uncharacterized protein